MIVGDFIADSLCLIVSIVEKLQEYIDLTDNIFIFTYYMEFKTNEATMHPSLFQPASKKICNQLNSTIVTC